MKPIFTILSALLLMGSCSKETNCKSAYGSIEVYSDKLGAISIEGETFKNDYLVSKNAWLRVNLLVGSYQLKRNESNKIDTFNVVPCNITELVY